MKFPPYGKQLMEARKRGETPREVYVVTDWKLARAFCRIVLPDDFPLDDAELRYLAGLDVTLVYRARDVGRVPVIAKAILRARPRLLNAFDLDIPRYMILKSLTAEVRL